MTVFSTGKKNNSAAFRDIAPGHDIWRDAGGTDTLVLHSHTGPFLPPAWQIKASQEGLTVTSWDDSSLLIEGDHASGEGAEFIKHKITAWKDGQKQTETALLEIVTGREAVSALTVDGTLDSHAAIIADGRDDVIRAPSAGTAGAGFSEIYGNGGNDSITLSDTFQFRAFGGGGHDILRAQGSPDTVLAGGRGRDTLIGAAGDDLMHGQSGADLMRGGRGDDTLNGGNGEDTLRGGAGDDELSGDSFGFGLRNSIRDRLHGGAGNDTLHGGSDRDVLTGGSGADDFMFQTGAGPRTDIITDFNAAEDRIFHDNHTSPGRYSVRHDDGDTFLRFGGNTFAILRDVELTLAEIDLNSW